MFIFGAADSHPPANQKQNVSIQHRRQLCHFIDR